MKFSFGDILNKLTSNPSKEVDNGSVDSDALTKDSNGTTNKLNNTTYYKYTENKHSTSLVDNKTTKNTHDNSDRMKFSIKKVEEFFDKEELLLARDKSGIKAELFLQSEGTTLPHQDAIDARWKEKTEEQRKNKEKEKENIKPQPQGR